MVAAAKTGAEVLVVEDDRLVREAVRTLLEARGYAVALAGNGREALNYLNTHRRPRLILLDLTMPVMNGWEFRRQQRQDPELADIPVVVCSSLDSVQAEADLIGAEGHLHKPVTADELAETVSHFVPAGAEVKGEATAGPGPRSRSAEPGPP